MFSLFYVGSIILLSLQLTPGFSQCPFKHGSSSPDLDNGLGDTAPGIVPEAQFIQTTFIYSASTEKDLQFTQEVIDLINILRQRLKLSAEVTIENENVDCTDNGYSQCAEYPLNEPYHFIVVEDSSHGATVYSLDRKHNTNIAKTELALLDSFSRHSKLSLMPFASKQTENEVGFVREITVKELSSFAQKNRAKEAHRSPVGAIVTRSATELNLINERILEFRTLDVTSIKKSDRLAAFAGEELNDLLENEDEKYILILFWTKVNTESLHAFWLWNQVADTVQETNVVIGSVACHEEIDVCRAFAIGHQDKHTIFVYKNAQKIAAQFNMRDADFYSEWIKIITAGPVLRIDDSGVWKQVRQGYLPNLPSLGQRTAITTGIFQDEDSEEFEAFRKVAGILYGRYHLVYTIKPETTPSVTTFRPLEKTRRRDLSGNIDVPTLIQHITQSSLPAVLNLSQGFTSDLVYQNPKDLALLIHDNDDKLHSEFVALASKQENAVLFNFAEINRKYSVELTGFFATMQVPEAAVPLLCIGYPKSLTCSTINGDASLTRESLDGNNPNYEIELSSKKAHPLKHVQLEHINAIFGGQEVELLPEPVLARSRSAPHMSGNHPPVVSSGGGCPMMAHMNSDLRDEL